MIIIIDIYFVVGTGFALILVPIIVCCVFATAIAAFIAIFAAGADLTQDDGLPLGPPPTTTTAAARPSMPVAVSFCFCSIL